MAPGRQPGHPRLPVSSRSLTTGEIRRYSQPPMRPRSVVLAVAALALTAASCSTSKAAPASARGPVEVLYAGSLVTLMEKTVGPAFQSATGYTFSGVSGDSGALANEIKGRTVQGDVFISANPSKDQLLEGAANGNRVTWYAAFARSGLVLGFNQKSRFAADLRTKPWYDVISEPGFLLGRTDATTDPKGKLTVTALDDAATTDGAATKRIASDPSSVFPENTLVGRLQAGQLDGGFFYGVEAAAAGIPTVPLAGVPPLAANYTITVLADAPHAA